MTSRRGDTIITLPNNNQKYGAGGPGGGLGPVIPTDGMMPDKQPRNNAATAASAASVRALTSQAIAFYFRAPVKAFFRTRVDYLAYARSIHHAQAQLQPRPLGSDPDLDLDARDHARRPHERCAPGWLGCHSAPGAPPLIANVSVGAVLYTSYLQILGQLHPESAQGNKRAYPPPNPLETFTAGFLAGSIQSVLAAPLDAIQARYDHRDLMPASGKGKPRSMWTFSAEKLREIGLRGIFAGWGLSFMKDSMGSAVFFTTFEYVKAQGYYNFVRWYYGGLNKEIVDLLAMKRPTSKDKMATRSDQSKHDEKPTVIRPHYAIEPVFLLLAGIGASFGQQILLHPLNHIQESHAANPEKPQRKWRMMRAYYHAYQETWAHLAAEAKTEGISLTRWFYRGFWWNTIRQVPSTSAGLIIFELVRRKYGMGGEEIRITKDGYDILLA
ncbi:hypothetical protein PG990_014174 [Apiospora arundinis]